MASTASEQSSVSTTSFSQPQYPLSLKLGPHPGSYTCTIAPNCDFVTQSHTQWFEHETRAHPGYLDIYLCDCVISGSSRRCKKGSFSRRKFDQHRVTHELEPFYVLDDHLLGPRMGCWFWCGYCRWIMDAVGVNNWYRVRTQHVMNHFTGKHVSASAVWTFPEFIEADG